MRSGVKQPINDEGRLRDELLPAVYFDTSVIVDYWSAEGIETSRGIDEDDPARLGDEYEEAVRNLFKYTGRLDKMADVRELVQLGESECVPVTTPLAILELTEWHAHASFKQIASQAAGNICVDRLSRKEVGDYLKRIYKAGIQEAKEVDDSHNLTKAPKVAVMRDCFLNLSFMECHGLNGVLKVDLKNFTIDAKHLGSRLFLLAFHQIGLADLLHIAAASHLGCKYFASFDSDFRRCREVIKEDFDLELIESVDALLTLLKRPA